MSGDGGIDIGYLARFDLTFDDVKQRKPSVRCRA